MFKKFTSALSSGLDKVVDYSQAQILVALTKRYPDIGEVQELLALISNESNEAIEGPEGADEEDVVDDGKWRPILLTVGLLYKLQKIQDSGENWYNDPAVFVQDGDHEINLLAVFGFYWHLLVEVSGLIKSSDVDHSAENCQDLLKEALNVKLGGHSIETLLAHATDSSSVADHCPDFALLLDRTRKLIVINICGTRMIPAPKMSDVFMDLHATAIDCLHGKAHGGMAIGAKNIMIKIKDLLQEAVDNNPDFGILVTGYSLGAGISQLVAMDLLQERPNVRCISYGAPLIFAPDIDNPEPDNDAGQHLYTVVCNHDGLASASVCTVTRLVAQVKAIDKLQLRKRDMIKLMMSSVAAEDGTDMKEEDDSDGDEDYDKEKLSHKAKVPLTPDWERINEAVTNVEMDSDITKLTHPSKNIFVFKRRTSGEVITRHFQDGAYHFADNLRLRGAMFSHHMPWSYNSLFQGYALDQTTVSQDLIATVLKY